MIGENECTITVHTEKYFGGIEDGEIICRSRSEYYAVKDKIVSTPLPRHDIKTLESIYELHHLEMTSCNRAIGHYYLKSEKVITP